MKKFVGLSVAALATVVLLGACGNNDKTSSSSSSSSSTSEVSKSSSSDSKSSSSEETVAAEEYIDGEYTAEASDYNNGYKEYVTITIADGKISTVDFDAKNESGELKTDDAEYAEKMEAANKTFPKKYMKELEDELITAQSTKDVDAVTGATTSSDDFKKLADAALQNAAKGDTETAVVTL